MIKSDYFSNFSVGDHVQITFVGLLRKKTYLDGEVQGVRKTSGKEFLIIKKVDGDMVDVSPESVENIHPFDKPMVIPEVPTKPYEEEVKSKYSRV